MRAHGGRMRNLKALPLVVFTAFLLCCTGRSQTAQPTLKLSVVSGVPVVDGVYLNGHGPFRFVLDTGNQTNQIDRSLARKLRLPASFRSEMDTPGGSARVTGTAVDRVSLGPLEARAQEFLITDGHALQALGPDVRGILGQTFLRNFDYMLDLRHHRIAFGAQEPAGSRVGFRLVDGCMVLPSNLGDLMLDSGTDTLFLFRASPLLTNASIVTTAGGAQVAVGRAPVLRLGGREYTAAEASYRPLADAPAAGLLPAGLFHALYVSNSQAYVVLNPGE